MDIDRLIKVRELKRRLKDIPDDQLQTCDPQAVIELAEILTEARDVLDE